MLGIAGEIHKSYGKAAYHKKCYVKYSYDSKNELSLLRRSTLEFLVRTPVKSCPASNKYRRRIEIGIFFTLALDFIYPLRV